MKNNTKTEKLKREYEKVYENPLNWCPLFGYLPKIEKSHFYNNESAYKIAVDCLDIMNGCRENFGVDYRPALHMMKYVCIPELKTILPEIDDEGKMEFEALRFLFQNLDYLTLETAHTYNPWIATKLHYCGELKAIPNIPIGRTSNHYSTCYSEIVHDVRVDRIVREYLLSEAQKITGRGIDLDYVKLFSLYAILEAWLILTALFFNTKLNADKLLYYRERLSYANVLTNLAERYSVMKQHEPVYREKYINEQTEKKRQKSSHESKINQKETDKQKIKKIFNDLNIKNISKKSRKSIIDKIQERTITESCQQGWSYNRIDTYLDELEAAQKILTLPKRKPTGPKSKSK